MSGNPFKPTAGKNPPVLVGRDYVLDEFVEGIENGPGAPGRLMRVSGARGMGKTVMLNEIASRARDFGWDVIEETANEGFCERILSQATPHVRVSKVSASPTLLGFSLGEVDVEQASLSLRTALSRLADKNGHGVLVTLDEVQDASLNEMRALSVAIQHVIREDGSIAFVFAGLPFAMESVVNGKTLTFLRRAVPVDLTPVGITEVAVSFERAMAESSMTIDSECSRVMAEATQGYPFMIQLVGYHVWQACHNAGLNRVTSASVVQGVQIARERFDKTVIEPALQHVSPAQLGYLLAMAQDDGRDSSTGAVARRLGKTAQQTSVLRSRLLADNVIWAPARGRVSFVIPYLADYLNVRRDYLESELPE